MNAYLTKTAYKLLTSKKNFENLKMMFCEMYINELIFLCLYIRYTQ